MKKPTIKDLPDGLLQSLMDNTLDFLLIDGCSSSKDWRALIENEKAPLGLTELHYTYFHIKITKDKSNYKDFAEKLRCEQLRRVENETIYK